MLLLATKWNRSKMLITLFRRHESVSLSKRYDVGYHGGTFEKVVPFYKNIGYRDASFSTCIFRYCFVPILKTYSLTFYNILIVLNEISALRSVG